MRIKYYFSMMVELEVKKGEIPDEKWQEISLGDLNKEMKKRNIINWNYGEVNSVIGIEKNNNNRKIVEIHSDEPVI